MIKKGLIVVCLLALVSCKSGGLHLFGKKKSTTTASGSIIRTTKTPVLNGSNVAKKEANKEVKTVTLEATTKVQVTTALVQEYIQKYTSLTCQIEGNTTSEYVEGTMQVAKAFTLSELKNKVDELLPILLKKQSTEKLLADKKAGESKPIW